MNSFVAFIDEAGDDGFKFRPHPQQGSSEWFVLGACVMREKNRAPNMRRVHDILGPIEKLRQAPVHFRKLNHEQRVAVSHLLGSLSMRIVTVPINKIATDGLAGDHTLKGHRRLYFYYTRYILERISWITRDFRVNGEGDGFCKVIFSRCKGLRYEDLKEYLHKLKNEPQNPPIQIDWTAIDPERIEVLQHEDSMGVRLADGVASGMHCALELSKEGFCEDRYLRLMKPKIYERNGNYLSYGFKVVPSIPEPEPHRDGRYACMEWFKDPE